MAGVGVPHITACRWQTTVRGSHCRKGRHRAERTIDRATKEETLSLDTGLPSIQWIAEQAATDPNFVFYTIVHYIDEDLLGMAFQQLSKNKAPGIDGETAAEYAKDLQANLRDLHERLTTKQYQASSIKRVWIDKEDGSQRQSTRV